MNKQNNNCNQSLVYNSNSNKVWYNQYRGYIVKNWIDPNTNLIVQEKMQYNNPNNIIHFFDDYFRYKLN